MPTYRVTYRTPLVVTVTAVDGDEADYLAWDVARSYSRSLKSTDPRIQAIEADFDGVDADSVEEIQ